VEVNVDSEGGPQKLFTGEVVGIEPLFDTSGSHRLTVRAFNRLHRLTRGRKSKTWVNVSDADILGGIAREHGLKFDGDLPAIVYDHVYQHNQTDLELLFQRAARIGRTYHVDEETLRVAPLSMKGDALPVECGKTVQRFAPRMSTHAQVESVTVRGWNPKTRQAIVGKASSSGDGSQAAKDAHQVSAQYFDIDEPIFSQEEANQIANAKLQSLQLSYLTADGSMAGDPRVKPGVVLDVSAAGDRFSGKYLVTGVSHRYSQAGAGGYSLEFHCRHNPSTSLFSLLTGSGDNPANHAPPVHLMLGLVTNVQDPDDLGRVKVTFPTLSDEVESWWARVVAPGAGKERGIQYLPEVGDEVLVGFPFGEITIPVIVGGLWNGQDTPPLPTGTAVSGGKVEKRVIKSRTGHTVTLDDAPSGGGITIEDPKGNKIFLDTQQNSLTIDIKRDIDIKAQGNIKITAQGNLEIKANGQASVEASATMDIKGAIVNLN
jgi:uncharacterized protein involved in type VI secretion and phage assembly